MVRCCSRARAGEVGGVDELFEDARFELSWEAVVDVGDLGGVDDGAAGQSGQAVVALFGDKGAQHADAPLLGRRRECAGADEQDVVGEQFAGERGRRRGFGCVLEPPAAEGAQFAQVAPHRLRRGRAQ
jgi:hypothetical protein